MDGLFAILGVLLYALLGLLLAVVLLPLRARATGAVHDGMPAGAASADWGFGLLGVRIDTDRRVAVRLLWLPVARFRLRAGKAGEERRREERRPKEGREAKEEQRGALRRLRGALADREAFARMAGRIVRALHLRLRAAGRVGIGDPADTVALHALLSAAGRLPGVELEVELDWVEDVLELEAEATARIWIAELLGVVAGLLLARRNRRALRIALGRA